jgi:hypothetical protein
MSDHPVRFAVDYPDRDLNRLTTALRIFTVIPIAIVLGSIGGYSGKTHWDSGSSGATIAIGGTGLLFLPPLLMILFRQKYPLPTRHLRVRPGSVRDFARLPARRSCVSGEYACDSKYEPAVV